MFMNVIENSKKLRKISRSTKQRTKSTKAGTQQPHSSNHLLMKKLNSATIKRKCRHSHLKMQGMKLRIRKLRT